MSNFEDDLIRNVNKIWQSAKLRIQEISSIPTNDSDLKLFIQSRKNFASSLKLPEYVCWLHQSGYMFETFLAEKYRYDPKPSLRKGLEIKDGEFSVKILNESERTKIYYDGECVLDCTVSCKSTAEYDSYTIGSVLGFKSGPWIEPLISVFEAAKIYQHIKDKSRSSSYLADEASKFS